MRMALLMTTAVVPVQQTEGGLIMLMAGDFKDAMLDSGQSCDNDGLSSYSDPF